MKAIGDAMRLNGIKKNNKGMTLVELLVAVAIFMAAILPLLHAFVYSTSYNFKSQQTMQSTGIAEAIIESAKGADKDGQDIMNELSSGAVLTGTGRYTINGGVTNVGGVYNYSDVRVTASETADAAEGHSGRRSYDVKVEFSPIDGGVVDYSSIQSMSIATANFTDANAIALQGQDMKAMDEIINLIKTDVIKDANVSGGPTPADPDFDGDSYFTESDIIIKRIVVERLITITASDSGVNVLVEYYAGGYDTDEDGVADGNEYVLRPHNGVLFKGNTYDLSCKGALADDYSLSSGNPFYTAVLGSEADGSINLTGGATSAVFFYYYPGYVSRDNNTISINDHFDLYNNMTSSFVKTNADGTTEDINRFDFYIFKQYDPDVFAAGASVYQNCEDKYLPTFDLHGSSVGTLYTYLYHNLLWYSKTGDEIKPYGFSSYSSMGLITEDTTNNFYNMTVYDSNYNNASYLPNLHNADMESYLLSDEAVMPYLHEPNGDATPRVMYNSRYEMTVYVYERGSTTPIEEMKCDVLTW